MRARRKVGDASIMIVAGEASGDEHGAKLAAALRAQRADIDMFGMGASNMRAAGVELLIDSGPLAVVGLVEVLEHYPALRTALNTLKRALRERWPTLLILIDYPDFNLRLAKSAREAGVKILYYVSPQIWAWRRSRVHKIRALVDMMAVVFPFEVRFYEQAGVPVHYVGHPLLDGPTATLSKEESFRRFGLDPSKAVVGLFPGSRRSEIRHLLPVLLDTAKLLRGRFADLQLLMPVAPTLERTGIAPRIEASGLDIRLIDGDYEIYDVIQTCNAIATASGTATLQIAIMGVPLVIIYRVSTLSYYMARPFIKLERVGLANIVAGKEVAPELLQHDARPVAIAEEVTRLLTDETYAGSMREKLADVKEKLGKPGCAERVAALALGMLIDSRPTGCP